MEHRRTVVLTNSQWYRGKGGLGSALLTGERMCCLGFDAVSSGVPERCILGVSYPSRVDTLFPEDGSQEARWAFVTRWETLMYAPEAIRSYLSRLEECEVRREADSPLETWVAIVNDSIGIDDETRLALLTKLFDLVGVDVKFDPDA